MLPDRPDPWFPGSQNVGSETETEIDTQEPNDIEPTLKPDEWVDGTDWLAIAGTLRAIGRLKRLPRTGWLDRGVPEEEAESVADHAFRVSLLAWMVAARYPIDSEDQTGLDTSRVLLIALAHDLPETFAGDPTPYAPGDVPPESDPEGRRTFLQQRQERDPTRAAAKRAAEAESMARLLAGLPPAIADQLGGAWREYEEQATPEARLVKQADRLETYLQSREYLSEDATLPMASFALQITDPATLSDPAMRALRDAIDQVMGERGVDE